MKVIVSLLINRSIRNKEALDEYVKNVETYYQYADQLYIYNFTTSNLEEFYERLSRYENIKYAETNDLGEVANYKLALDKMHEEGADYGVILELGYYYEEGSFLACKRFIMDYKDTDLAILTPMPLLGCQIHERKSESSRTIKGCKLIGAFINLNVYYENTGFRDEYYQTTFDYEYCIRKRLENYKVILMPNEVIRNSNYRVLERRIFFTVLKTYDFDLMDVYYETRNRFYLWDEYQYKDYEYVKLDKKLYKEEHHEMRMRDKGYKEKFMMMDQAKKDYKKGLKGKYKGK